MQISQLFITAVVGCISSVSLAGELGPIQDDSAFKVFIPNLKPGFELTGSLLVLQPGAGNLGWAATTTVLPIPTPNWSVESFDPTYKPGFNIGARYVFENSGTDIQVNWSYLSTHYSDTVQVNPASQWVSPFSQTGTPPTGGEITGVASLKSAEAKLDFTFNALNLDMGKFVNFGTNLQTRFFTGLSSAWIKEQLVSNFYGAPKAVLKLNNKSTYAGVGPRLGFNNSYEMYHRLRLVGQFAGAILIGSMQPAQYQFTGFSSDLALVGIGANNEQIGSESVTQIVPALDAKLGLSYNYIIPQKGELTFELGYMGALYINPLSAYETNTNVIALDTGSLSTSSVKHVQTDFSVAGPYMTVRYQC